MKLKYIISLFVLNLIGVCFGQQSESWGGEGTDPRTILQRVQFDSQVQPTKLDNVEGNGIYETLFNLKYGIGKYIEWAVYIGLALAVIFVIYNGLLLAFSPVKEEALSKVKSRLFYLFMGIFGLIGFSLIIKIVISIVGEIGG